MADSPPSPPPLPTLPSLPQPPMPPSPPSPGGMAPSIAPAFSISPPSMPIPSMPGGPGGAINQSQISPEELSRVEGQRKTPASVGRPNLPQEFLEKWEQCQNRTLADFLYTGTVLPVTSSNVKSFQYSIKTHELTVAYKSGIYKYFGVTEQEAESLATAGSHGSAAWSILRVRGSKTAHKKSYIKLG